MSSTTTEATVATPDEAAPTAAERMQRAKNASRAVGLLSDARKRDALLAIADLIDAHVAEVVAANAVDLQRGRENGLSDGLLDRLTLDPARVAALAAAVRDVAELPDPVGRILDEHTLPNGIRLQKVSVPFGVIGSIYEARPNVTVDIAALALRSGNAVVLRGGSAALESNRALVDLIRRALADVGIDPEAVQTVDDFGRDGARALMGARGVVDVLVPRGSAQLIETVVTESAVPVIETGAGVVHIYLDASAPLDRARDIVVNAKVQRPSVCNAVETVLVHQDAADRVVAPVVAALQDAGVVVHGDAEVARRADGVVPAVADDWATEHMSLELSMRVVPDLDEALDHIRRYSTHHT
jgi:glutamate-5-semialdehyde dehydrogenase